MASLDFELETNVFSAFYDDNRHLFEKAKNYHIRKIKEMIKQSDVGEVTKVEGRVKVKEECIKKFHRKYQIKLESEEQNYQIKDYISDLIGIRIVCLYEDQIAEVSALLKNRFKVIDVTDKITAVESTEDSFGYKGLHMDMALNDEMGSSPKVKEYAKYAFEVQIRTLIQDAWSVLDHKIKYKKSIPNDLKRRINVLSALFEMADREFKEIRNATLELIQQATATPISDALDARTETAGQAAEASGKSVNAFNFLRVAGHFFKDFEFEDYKVDNFVQDILKINNGFRKSDLHRCLIENLKTVRGYRDDFMAETAKNNFSPYTAIRHCLYLGDQGTFGRILSRRSRARFDSWLEKTGHPTSDLQQGK